APCGVLSRPDSHHYRGSLRPCLARFLLVGGGGPSPEGPPVIVAIDGPAGAGKSTVARTLAERLGFRYLDTGAMYRSLTWLALKQGMPLGDGEPLGKLAAENPVTFDPAGRVYIDGSDVTSAIRQVRVDRMVPVVARHPEVRAVMR